MKTEKHRGLLIRYAAILICTVAVFLFIASAGAERMDSGDYSYCVLEDGTVSIKLYNGNEADVVIPATLDGKQVTKIDDNAFNGREVVSVTVPEGVVSIENRAFANCEQLTAITLPESLTKIGDSAFSYCIALTAIRIPDTVTVLGNRVFDRCISMTTANLPTGLAEMGEDVFCSCQELRSVTIPEGTTCLGNLAFEWCEQLTSVTLPDSLVKIGDNPFTYSGVTEIIISPDHPVLYCEDAVLFNREEKALISCLILPDRNRYTIPDGTEIVADYAFAGCQNMYAITVPDSVVSVSAHSFDCNNLHLLAISPDHPVLAVIDDVIFRKEDKRLIRFPIYRPSADNELYEIPEGIRIIGEYAFDHCYDLKAVVIPDSVTTIEDGAFRECQRMKTLTIGNGVTTIGDNVTDSCRGLEKITLPASLTSIGQEFLYYSSNVTVTVPRGSYAAHYCEERGKTCVLTDPEE